MTPGRGYAKGLARRIPAESKHALFVLDANGIQEKH